ncbi:hypothetical protein BD770DRAFT_390269 [Pilaira anomala]|nr:hypothetical protein BD770DRAFT_390269 [Pilaira anomala]
MCLELDVPTAATLLYTIGVQKENQTDVDCDNYPRVKHHICSDCHLLTTHLHVLRARCTHCCHLIVYHFVYKKRIRLMCGCA